MCLMSYYAETGRSRPWSPDFKNNSIIVLFLHRTNSTGLNIVCNIGYHFVELGGQFKWGSIHNRVIMGFQWMVCWLLLVHYATLFVGLIWDLIRANGVTRAEWTSTHQCTNLDGWCTNGCTFFFRAYPCANQGGEHRLTIFFLFLDCLFLFLELVFFAPCLL
jgi:hypothetical protein